MSAGEDQRLLIDRAKQGDRSAIEQLLLCYAPLLSEHIGRRLLPSLDRSVGVDDILQETLLKAFLGIGTLQQTSPQAFFAWLRAIADMRLLDALKAQRRQKRGGQLHRVRASSDTRTARWDELIEQLPADLSTASRRMARDEIVLAIQVSVAGLPDDQREAIRLHLLEGKSLQETAEALNRSTSAVRSLIHRGKQHLAEALGRASLWLSGR